MLEGLKMLVLLSCLSLGIEIPRLGAVNSLVTLSIDSNVSQLNPPAAVYPNSTLLNIIILLPFLSFFLSFFFMLSQEHTPIGFIDDTSPSPLSAPC
jgi:hypothetical protein